MVAIPKKALTHIQKMAPGWQSVVIDAKCERIKLPVTDVHRLYFTYIAILRAFRYLQDGFSFVVQLCTDMSSCVIIPLVQMQYGVNMQIIPT